MRFTLTLLLFLTTVPITAQSISTQQSATIKKIEEKLMAPCCYTQNIHEHMSEVAEQMREEVTAKVLAGNSEQEILDYYKAEYGDTILVVPDGNSGRFLFGTPYALLLLSGGILSLLLLNAAKRKKPTNPLPTPVIHDANWLQMRQRIRAETGEPL